MGKYAKEFFSRSNSEFIKWPKTKFRLLTLDDAKEWLIRDKWTISDAAALFCGFNPPFFYPNLWADCTQMSEKGLINTIGCISTCKKRCARFRNLVGTICASLP